MLLAVGMDTRSGWNDVQQWLVKQLVRVRMLTRHDARQLCSPEDVEREMRGCRQ